MKCLNESILKSFKEAFLLEDYKSAKVKLVERGASEDEADSLISRHKELKKLNRLDKSLIDIDTLVKTLSPEEIKQKLFNISTQTKSEIKKRIEGKIVDENDEYWVYKIDTPEEAYRFHGLTKWCICSGQESEARTHFIHYSNGLKNVYYFFVRKNITDPEDEWNYIALQRGSEGYDVYWSMIDKKYKLPKIPVNLPEFDKPPLEPPSIEEIPEMFIQYGFKKNSNGEFDIDCNFDVREHEYLIVGGKLAVRFGKVRGDFICSNCYDLTSLEGCPREVSGDFYCDCCVGLMSLDGCPKEVGGDFYCDHCKNLTNLKGGPREVGGDFSCYNCNNLTNLEGCPEKIGGDFDCSSCYELKSLESCPEKIGGDFDCTSCYELTSLKGCPREVGGSFNCYYCKKLTNLKGCPEKVGGSFNCYYCKNITSLEGCPEEVGKSFDCSDCGIEFTEDEVRSLCVVGGKIVC